MKRLVLLCSTALFAVQAYAANPSTVGLASDGISSSIGIFSLSFISTSESANLYSQQTKDDAASFVASGGDISGPGLQKAIQDHRQLNPESIMSDMDIAYNLLVTSIE